jgi:ABC-type polysaccharide/polyol phosphate export permease
MSRAASPVTSDRFLDRTTHREVPLETIGAIASHRELLKNLVLRDLKLKYRGSVLGFLWSLLNPLAVVLAFTFAFKYILQSGQSDYPFFVLLGVLAWTFFAGAMTMSTGSIIESAGLVKAVQFPRAILPVATVFFTLAQYLLTATVFLPLLLLLRQQPLGWPMLLYPVFLLLQVVMTIGLALLLAAATTYFRDVRHLVEVSLQLLFWMTPIVYSVEAVPEALRPVLLASPMSPFITAYHDLFYYVRWPEAVTWIAAVGYAVGGLAVGVLVFTRLQDELGEQL